MPDFRRRVCRLNKGGCGKSSDVVGPISWRGLCLGCATEHVAENVTGLAEMSGPPLERWRRGMAACVGAVFLDDPPSSP